MDVPIVPSTLVPTTLTIFPHTHTHATTSRQIEDDRWFRYRGDSIRDNCGKNCLRLLEPRHRQYITHMTCAENRVGWV